MAARLTQQFAEVLATGNPAARLSQQFAEVLATGNPAARLSQHFVEVLVSLGVPVSASDTLTFSDTASYNIIKLTPFSDIVTFTDVMTGVALGQIINDTLTLTDAFRLTFSGTATDSITFSDVAFNIKEGIASDTLTFSDTASCLKWKIVSASDTLTFVATPTVTTILVRTISEAIVFTEVRTRNIIRLVSASDTLTFTETRVATNSKRVVDTLTFSDSFTNFVAKGARDILDLGDIFYVNTILIKLTADNHIFFDVISVQTTIRRTLTNSISFSDVATGVVVKQATDSISFTATPTAVASKFASATLTFVETLSVLKIKNVTVTDNLSLVDVLTKNIVITYAASDFVLFIEDKRTSFCFPRSLSDTITFSETLFREIKVGTIPDTITFSDTMVCVKVASRAIADTIVFAEVLARNSVATTIINDVIYFLDDQNVPEGYEIEKPPRTRPVGTVYGKYMMLIGFNKAVVLPPAEFNDFYASYDKTIIKRVMNGSIRTYNRSDPNEKIHYEWVISRTQADKVREFLLAEANNKINIIDWQGRHYDTELSINDIDIIETGRWSPCGNKVRLVLEFTGIRYA